MPLLPESEEEGQFRLERAVRFGVLTLWAVTAVTLAAGAHRWVAHDYDGFVLCWAGVSMFALTLLLISGAGLGVSRTRRGFFAASLLVSIAIAIGSGTLVVTMPKGAAERFRGSIIEQTPHPQR